MHAYLCRPKKSRVRLRARTPPFHGGDTGSNPVRGTTSTTLHVQGFFMVSVYVIESMKDKTWYTGIALEVNKRLREHNSGKNRFTKGHLPWRIIYTEAFLNWEDARMREKYFKTYAGKNWIRKKLSVRGTTSTTLHKAEFFY